MVKGQLQTDTLSIIMLLALSTIAAVFAVFFITEIIHAYPEAPEADTGPLEDIRDKFVIFDYFASALLILAVFLGGIITSAFVRTHPIFFIVAMFAVLIMLPLVGAFTDIITTILSASMFDDATESFERMIWCIQNAPLIYFASTIVGVIVFYGRV